MGAHHPRHAEPSDPRLGRIAAALIAPIAVLTGVALVLLWPSEGLTEQFEPGAAPQWPGVVRVIETAPCPEPAEGDVNGCGTATVRLSQDDGERDVETLLPGGPGAPEVAVGDRVVVISSTTPDGEVFSIVDHQRGRGLWLLGAAFAVVLVAFGRLRGLSALVGLAVTFVVLLAFVIPAILGGAAPLLIALVASSAIVLTVLYLTHGFSLPTTVAVLGTLISLGLTAGLSWVAVSALHLTGVTDDLSSALGLTYGVDMQGLLLAGIVIGSVGVLDDVTVTQSVTVAELARANPAYRFGELFSAGSRVGRAHIASVVNTIVLAYAGSSLPLLILIVASAQSLGTALTDQILAQEIVRSAVATLGLVAAVPVTTALAALTARAATAAQTGH